MERKIGEIFEFGGEWYQCIIGCHCPDCVFCNDNCEERERITLGNKLTKEETTGFCTHEFREDGKSVIFKKLEKVGEPYSIGTHIFQRYKVFIKPYIFNDPFFTVNTAIDDEFISIEIKQNQEDMEEKKVIIGELAYKYINGKITYEAFEKGIKELCDNKEESKPTLNEFDLEAAKSGKPVCTRDGRKARIICFDRRLFYKNVSYPILALVERSDGEDDVCCYNEKGKVLIEDGAEYKDDLMMLPEKKEGWVNIDKGGSGKITISSPYSTKEEAIHNDNECTIDTIKINWSE